MSDLMDGPDEAPMDAIVLNEMQLLLAEKRTALSTLRTGIAIFTFPLSILSVLIVTSRAYSLSAVWHWIIPLLLLNFGLVVLAVYLVVRALRKMQHYDRLIQEFKQKHSRLRELLG
jgi:uncharacterized membrane protein YidH (DUF202 family)